MGMQFEYRQYTNMQLFKSHTVLVVLVVFGCVLESWFTQWVVGWGTLTAIPSHHFVLLINAACLKVACDYSG